MSHVLILVLVLRSSRRPWGAPLAVASALVHLEGPGSEYATGVLFVTGECDSGQKAWELDCLHIVIKRHGVATPRQLSGKNTCDW